jgi:hypothetical protein
MPDTNPMQPLPDSLQAKFEEIQEQNNKLADTTQSPFALFSKTSWEQLQKDLAFEKIALEKKPPEPAETGGDTLKPDIPSSQKQVEEINKKIQEIEKVRASLHKAFEDQKTAIAGLKNDLDPKKAEEAITKINADFKTATDKAIETATVDQEEKNKITEAVTKLNTSQTEFIKKANEDKEHRLLYALHALQQGAQKNQAQGGMQLLNAHDPAQPSLTSEQIDGYKKQVADLEAGHGIAGFKTKYAEAFTDDKGKKHPEMIKLDTGWFASEDSRKTSRMGVIEAASRGWNKIKIQGGRESDQIEAMKQALVLPGLNATIIQPEGGRKLTAKEQKWNEILKVKASVIEASKNDKLISAQSELAEIYQKLSPQPELQQLFLTALDRAQFDEVANALQEKDKATNPNGSNFAQLQESLGALIINKEHKESPLVQGFQDLPSELKVNAIFQAAKAETTALEGTIRKVSNTPHKIQPFIKKLTSAEALNLLATVDRDQSFTGEKAEYKAKLKDEIALHLKNLNTRGQLDGTASATQAAFNQLSPADKANLYHDDKINLADNLPPDEFIEMYQGIAKDEQRALFLSRLSNAKINELNDVLQYKPIQDNSSFDDNKNEITEEESEQNNLILDELEKKSTFHKDLLTVFNNHPGSDLAKKFTQLPSDLQINVALEIIHNRRDYDALQVKNEKEKLFPLLKKMNSETLDKLQKAIQNTPSFKDDASDLKYYPAQVQKFVEAQLLERKAIEGQAKKYEFPPQTLQAWFKRKINNIIDKPKTTGVEMDNLIKNEEEQQPATTPGAGNN